MYNLYIMENSQTLTRTQIYLTKAQQTRLTAACRRSALTKSELIRQAVDNFLNQQTAADPADRAQQLQGLAGLWADRADMADPSTYVRKLRASRFS